MSVEGLSVLFVVGVVLGAIAYWRPMWGLALYANSVALDYGLSVAGFRLPAAVSVGQLALMLLLLVGVVRKARTQADPDAPPDRILRWVLLFIVAYWVSTAFAVDPSLSVGPGLSLTATAMLVWLLPRLVDSWPRFRQMHAALAVGAVMAAAVGVLQFKEIIPVQRIARNDLTEDRRGAVEEYRYSTGRDRGVRFSGPVSNPNGYGSVLLWGIPALLYFMLLRGGAVVRALACFGLCLEGVALMLAMSRTFLVCAAACVVITAALNWRNVKLQIGLVLGVAAVVVGLMWFGGEAVNAATDRVMRSLREETADTSTVARANIRQGGLAAFLSNPLVGIGPNNSTVAGFTPGEKAAHDVVSGVLGELGLFGALTMLFMLIEGGRLIWRLRSESHDGDEELLDITTLLATSLIATVLAGAGTPLIGARGLWMTLALISTAHHLYFSMPENPEFAGDDEASAGGGEREYREGAADGTMPAIAGRAPGGVA